VEARRGVLEKLNQKKRHHYLAQTYLRGFANPDGKVCVYSKDRPKHPWWAAPETVAFENYYYSQPTPEGGRDNNRLEDYFSSIEISWPATVSKIVEKNCDEAVLEELLLFAIVHRVRVPTARDASEKILAETVRMTARHLNDHGELPPHPPGLSFEYLDEHLVVSIDPHKSIDAMPNFAKGMGLIFNEIGFEILDNRTDEGFITTDNPVIYFDPTVPAALLQPYQISRSRMEIEFMFPITPRFMLWGHSAMKPLRGQRQKLVHHNVDDEAFVHRANVLGNSICKPIDFFQPESSSALGRKVCTILLYSVRHPCSDNNRPRHSRPTGVWKA
jgi:hypothetical protein